MSQTPTPATKVQRILIAPTKHEGRAWLSRMGATAIAIVTPRSPHAARGKLANTLEVLDTVSGDARTALIDECMPALATCTHGEVIIHS